MLQYVVTKTTSIALSWRLQVQTFRILVLEHNTLSSTADHKDIHLIPWHVRLLAGKQIHVGLNTQTTKQGSSKVSQDEQKPAHAEAVVNCLEVGQPTEHSRQGDTLWRKWFKRKNRMLVTFSVYFVICLENLCTEPLLKMRIRIEKKIKAEEAVIQP